MMGRNKRKLLVIGIDQAIPYLLHRFLKEGILPNIQQFANNGIIGEAYSSAPCDTPTNWTTIATGATTAVHGVTSFYMHLPGEALDLGMKYRSRTQLYQNCKAQYIWDVADNNKFKPFILNYPSGWPSIFKNGVMSLFTWPIPNSLPKMLIKSVIDTMIFDSKNNDTKNKIGKYLIDNIESISPEFSVEDQNYYRNIINIDLNKSEPENEIYDSLKITINHNGESKVVKENEWSQWISININSDYGVLQSLFRIKPIKIDPNAKYIQLERSGVYNTKGWSVPESFGEKLVKNVFEYDLPKKREVEFMIYGKMKKYLEYARNESLSLVQAIDFAKKDMNWNVCFFHYHPLDTINHDLLAYLHKDSKVYSEKKEENALKNVQIAYRIVDEMVGELMKRCIDKDTITLFISDHGAIPIWKVANITKILTKAGLMDYRFVQSQQKYTINWDKTLAFPYMEPPFIWVNLKGRDPQGIVRKEEYETVRDQIIDALSSARDPKTGAKVIEMALRKEEATFYGLNGERVGDVVYFLRPPYGVFDGILDALDASSLSSKEYNKPLTYDTKRFFGAHAYYTPETRFGKFSVSVPLIMSGNGIKKGAFPNKIINLTDIAPTLSYLLNIPKPEHAKGNILYDFLE
jgi:predicted AlkP superfamily phosphohydrolase/phosphomutase